MKRNLYLSSNGRLHRKESTIYYYTKDGTRVIPIDQVKSITAIGRVSVTSGVISFLSQKGIPLHFFGYYGNYEGSFYPRRRLVSGFAIVAQAAAHLDVHRRMRIARAIVQSCIKNMVFVCTRYAHKQSELSDVVLQLEAAHDQVPSAVDVAELMSIEGRAWIAYYSGFNLMLTNFRMGGRVKRPPNNPVNALISFGNSLLYSTILTQIFHTQLDPSISFLHEPMERRFSLALDIAEVFKPSLVHLLILKALNLRQLTLDDFDHETGCCLLNESGRRTFLSLLDANLRETVRHPHLKKSVSNEYLLRLDCYKLQRHITENSDYSPFLASRGY
ncbi:MAG: type I-B CRISPR-associated endonuclease Cas1 [Candidatus Thorarchaeota archaeon]|nr:type I-B CRISPR-associated endonuclease Cas1 [Candidatus Thorarchaeota archaeon]